MPHYQLRQGEHVIQSVRRHPVTIAVVLILEFSLLIFAFFFMAPLVTAGRFGVGIFMTLVGLALFFMFRSWLLWRSNTFIITDRRLIDVDRRGFFEWVVSETAFPNIQDISVTTRGLVQTVLGAGNVVVQTASGFVNLELHFVARPGAVKEAINEARGIWKDTDPVE